MNKKKSKTIKNLCTSCHKELSNDVDYFCMECLMKVNRGHDLW